MSTWPTRLAATLVGAAATLALAAPVTLAAPAAADPQPSELRATESTEVTLADVPETGVSSQGSDPAVVREVTRSTTFSMAALTWTGVAPTDTAVRARQPDGGWSPWFELGAIDGADDADGVTTGGATTGSEPVHLGATSAVQLRGAVPDPAATALVLITPDLSATPEPLAASAVGRPAIITRAQWGADESLRCQQPAYADRVKATVVHHTGDGQAYTADQSAAIIRGIYYYHAKTLGWCDIGYNAIVDEAGRVFEGAAGGIDRAVIGAHAGGFNTGTVGVLMLGDYATRRPAAAEIDGVSRYLAWQSDLWDLDPSGSVSLTSGGGVYTPYPAGQVVVKPQIMGHRDVDSTPCPGNVGYSVLPEIRDRTSRYLGATDTPRATTTSLRTTPTVAVGTSVAVFADVTPRPGAGTIRFAVDGVGVPGCTTRPVLGGTAACVVRLDSAGPHELTARYSGGLLEKPSTGTLAVAAPAGPSLWQRLLGALVDLAAALRLFGL